MLRAESIFISIEDAARGSLAVSNEYRLSKHKKNQRILTYFPLRTKLANCLKKKVSVQTKALKEI